jgi:hypothetical protein
MWRFVPRLSRCLSISLQSAELGATEAVQNQLLMKTALNSRSAEVWRQTAGERIPGLDRCVAVRRFFTRSPQLLASMHARKLTENIGRRMIGGRDRI